MNYSIEYITKIAIHKLGTFDKKGINEYVKSFDSSKEEYRKDVEEFESFQKKQSSEENNRKKYVEDVYYMMYYYKLVPTPEKASLFLKRLNGSGDGKFLESWFQDCFTSEPIEEQEGVSYSKDLVEFSKKYGINLNSESIINSLKSMEEFGENAKDFYTCYYKGLLLKNYEKVNKDSVRIDELCKDLEKVVKGIREVETPNLKGKEYDYGGMEKAELKDFLIDIREKDCNLTQKAENKFRTSTANDFAKEISKEIEENKSEETLIECVASLKVLQENHAKRSTFYSIIHPFKYRDEKNQINDLRQKIEEKLGSQKTNDLMQEEVIYKQGFKEERNSIVNFVDGIGLEKIEVDLKDKTTDLATSASKDLELDCAKQKDETIIEEVVKEKGI